jgi:hypothetical protein
MEPLEWTEEEKQHSAEIVKYLNEQVQHYKNAVNFLDMLDTLETDKQKFEWCKIAAKEYWERLSKAVEWLAAYRSALAKRFVLDVYPGVEWADVPLRTRRVIHDGIARETLGIDGAAVVEELGKWCEVQQRYFEPYKEK